MALNDDRPFIKIDFYGQVHEIWMLREVFQGRVEQLPLLSGRNIRNQDHQTRMQFDPAVQATKVLCVVGDEGEVLAI